MKIEKKYLIEIGNPQHPDFGIYAKFVDGMGKESSIEVPQPQLIHVCDVCCRPLWMEKMKCLYCMGIADANKSNVTLGHDHVFTVENPHCIRCGVFEKLITPSPHS